MGVKVYEAISAVQAELAKVGIAKTRTNTQGTGYKFRGIDDVYNVLAMLLAQNQLVIIPRILSRQQVERTAKGGGALFYTVVEAEFDFVAHDSSTHTAKTFGEAMDSGDKGTNKAMSAAYKYMAFMTFAIPIEGEPDADSTTHETESANDRITTEWVRKISEVAVESDLEGLKADIVEAYKGESNVPKVLKQAIRGRRAVLQGES